MPAVTDLLTEPAASERAAAEARAYDQRIETARAFHAQSMERGQRYVTLLIAAGFAAFFTIWNGFRPLLPAWAILITGAMIGVSLILFIGFEIWKAYVLSIQSVRITKALAGATAATWDKVMADEARATTREALRDNRIWPFVFYPTVVLGIGAAILLTAFGLFGASGLLGRC